MNYLFRERLMQPPYVLHSKLNATAYYPKIITDGLSDQRFLRTS